MTPTIYATLLGGAAAGAVLTALVSVFTGWLSRRHDQRRWLLDRRLEAYVAFNEALLTWRKTVLKGDSGKNRELSARLIDLAITINLVAPWTSTHQANSILSAVIDANEAQDDVRQRAEEIGNMFAAFSMQQRVDVQVVSVAGKAAYRLRLSKLRRELSAE